MNDVSPKNSLSLHSYFFENARGGYIFDIAHSPDAANEFETACPVNNRLGRFGCVSTTPVATAHNISDVSRVFTHAATNHSDDPIFPRFCDRPGELLTRIPSAEPQPQKWRNFAPVLIGPPSHVTCDLGIRRVVIEDIVRVGQSWLAEYKSPCRNYFGGHN